MRRRLLKDVTERRAIERHAPSLSSFTSLSDQDLLAAVHRLSACERQATAALIASLAELDARRLYLGEGCSSLFTYCTRVLHLSEHAAYGRIEAARAARRFPVLLERLMDGSLTLTAVGLLAPHLTPENHLALLDAARHRSKREVEQLVAALRPQPDVPSTVRKLPERASATRAAAAMAASPRPEVDPTRPSLTDVPAPAKPPAQGSAPPSRRPVIQPLAPARYRVQFTLDEDGVALLSRAQALMRHRVPTGDVAAVVAEGLKLLVDRLEKAKTAATLRPRAVAGPCAARSRTIPAAVRRAVWTRDAGRCAFVGGQGRCTETSFLEFHHVHPYAEGGAATTTNIQLRCRAHNQYEAEQYCGGSLPWTAREAPGVCDGCPARSGPSSAGVIREAARVYRGLLNDARSDDELAVALGHELAH